jgi:N-acetylneuraminate synthase/N,N'-diacetyllegionaminate synthase
VTAPRSEIRIAGRPVGQGHPCFIIAEAGVNHNGDVALARELVHAAKECGADAVKFQTFKAERVATPYAPKAAYQLIVTDPGESQFDMLKKLELSEAVHEELLSLAGSLGLVFLSTPYSSDDASMLNRLDLSAFKVASGQIVELSFLEFVARLGKPIILSTGMSSLEEVSQAVATIRKAGNGQVILLQTTTNYPASPDEVNLLAMDTMARTCSVNVGYSDHTPGMAVALAAVARGACVIEKHFTLDRSLPGPDQQCSADPDELAELVRGIRQVEAALGDGRKRPSVRELSNLTGMRRSIVAAVDIPPGRTLTPEMLSFKRPGTGISPARLEEIIGRKTAVIIPRDTLLSFDQLQ